MFYRQIFLSGLMNFDLPSLVLCLNRLDIPLGPLGQDYGVAFNLSLCSQPCAGVAQREKRGGFKQDWKYLV